MSLDPGTSLTIVGLILLAGFIAHGVGQRLHLPRVTLILGLGALAGPAGLDVVPEAISNWFGFITHVALAFVGFLLGEELAIRREPHHAVGTTTFVVTLLVMLATLVAVAGATWAAGAPIAAALVYGGIAMATDPAATLDVIRESDAEGPLTELVVQIVALDDALGLALFTLCLVGAEAALGHGLSIESFGTAAYEILGAVVLGLVLGVPMAWLTGRIRPGEPSMAEASGFVMLCGGLATLMHVSYLLAAMTMGAVVARVASHHEHAFHEIEDVTDPLLIVFFFLAGFALEPRAFGTIGTIGAVYIVARIAGRLIGGRLASALGVVSGDVGVSLGWSLLPQAGVALGLALLARERIGDAGGSILQLVIGTTVLFELIGPLLTRWRLNVAGETGQQSEAPP
jgi:Kef-type K+ transport system membrane component KefB